MRKIHHASGYWRGNQYVKASTKYHKMATVAVIGVIILTLWVVACHIINPDTEVKQETKQVYRIEEVTETLQRVCKEHGYTTTLCWRTLYAMVQVESTWNPIAIGDGGKSRGYFQIRTELHKISVGCAEELECATNWTLDYLDKNGAKIKGRWWFAVRSHNGSGSMAQKYVEKVRNIANTL
jgi:hypothetical protein